MIPEATTKPNETIWQDGCIALVYLLTDYRNGGKLKPKLKDMRSGRIFQSPELLIDSPESRRYLAPEARHSDYAVFNLGDIIRRKGKATELYRITREDYQAYLKEADEADEREEKKA